MYQLDLKAAYLNAEVDEELYMNIPDSFGNSSGFLEIK